MYNGIGVFQDLLSLTQFVLAAIVYFWTMNMLRKITLYTYMHIDNWCLFKLFLKNHSFKKEERKFQVSWLFFTVANLLHYGRC
ncbi:unnamed protein product [Brugia timori]|uniref:Uncharacterized protein n=1 Tax=Brugia timori TaxID=42155 RepID=A0A3P7VX58_9BILA|nr:unnamed protein product [Brugia timori]